MADIDLKAMGISQDPLWWEPILNVGMIFAALFQVFCIGFAIFGPESTPIGGKQSEKRKTSVINQRRKHSPPPSAESQGAGRRKSKQDKKRR